MMRTYYRTIAGQRLYIRADFAQASSPILFSWGDLEDMQPTPWQVANARHSVAKAFRMVEGWEG